MKYYIKCILQKIIIVFLLPLRLCPIKKGRVLFLSLEGGAKCEYSCNPKYICEYFLAHPNENYKLVWLFRHPEEYSYLKDSGILLGKHFTLKGFYYALTSEFVISNGGYLTWFPFRKDQTVINTWHGGGAYKKLENDMPGANKASAARMKHSATHTNLFLSSSELFTKHVICGAFGYEGKVLTSGMPRNDCLLAPSEDYNQKIRDYYGIPSQSKIILYAPTFRSNDASDFKALDVSAIFALLASKSDEEWYILCRSHIQSVGQIQYINPHKRVIDVSEYPDTQELLCAADMLITDYSSIIWDYCLTDKPILLYTPDYESYTKGRGFYLDMEKWGYPLCHNMEELLLQIKYALRYPFTASKVHKQRLGSLETGHACEDVYNYIACLSKQE